MKKILLINTPQNNTLKAGIEDDFIDIIGFYPPLGLLYLGTVLENKGYDVKILDCVPMNIGYKELKAEIEKYSPFAVGITTFTTSMVDALLTAEIVKKINPQIITILGGHHATLYPAQSIKYKNIDFILQGEGEETLPILINKLSKTKLPLNLSEPEIKDFLEIDGIGFYQKNIEYLNHKRAYINDIETLPIPNRKLLPSKIYTSIVGRQAKVATIMSSRGCPFKCTYCFTPNKTYRTRTTQNIIEEVKYLINLGYNEIFFFDDLFAMKAQKVIDFAKALQAENIKIDWSFRARINTITPELVEEVKKAGIHRIQFGIESGVDKTLKRVRKGIKTKKIRESIALCKKAGITTIGNFMIGLPGETKHDINTTLKFSRKIGLNYAQYSILVPFPFTAIYMEGLENNLFTHDYWKEFSNNPIENAHKFKVQYWTENVSEEYLFKMIKKSFKRFYFRPITIINKLKEIKSWQEMKNAIKGAFSVFKFNPK